MRGVFGTHHRFTVGMVCSEDFTHPTVYAGMTSGVDINKETAVETSRLTKLTIEASVCLGKQRVTLSDLCQLKPGVILSFQTPCEVPLLTLNGTPIASGEPVCRGRQLGFRLNRIVAASQ